MQWRDDEKHAEAIATHAALRESSQFQDAAKFLRRLVTDFMIAVHLASVAFTRYPESQKWMLQRETDGLIESAIAILALASDGAINPARREMRHMLEAVAKFVYVDQQLPGDTLLDERISFLNSKVPRSSISIVDDINFRLVNASDLTNEAKSTFSRLCGYVHPSKQQTDERLARYKRGEFIGFESVAQVRAFNRELARCLDVVLALVFEGVGPSFTGDLMEAFHAKTSWKFHKTKYVKSIEAHFAHKFDG